jgi:hypothetical protein
MPDIKKFPFTPILGWSNSRYELFSICKRKYFYHYYNKYDPDIPRRDILRFRELVTIPLEIGSIVHEVIETLLRRLKQSTEEIDTRRLLEFADSKVDIRLKESPFEELVYGQEDQLTKTDLSPAIHRALENLLESDRFGWLMRLSAEHAGEWIIDPPGYGETRLEELKAYFKVDFLFPFDQGYHIIDWKTGKVDQERHRKQLMGYSTWACYHFEVDPGVVWPRIVYLRPDYLEVEETFTAEDLGNFAVQVRAETQEMYDYCRDVEANIPLDKSEFPLVENAAICMYCNFRGLCFPEEYPFNFDRSNPNLI